MSRNPSTHQQARERRYWRVCTTTCAALAMITIQTSACAQSQPDLLGTLLHALTTKHVAASPASVSRGPNTDVGNEARGRVDASGDVSRFDIAGIRLGMPPAEVATALRSRGYIVKRHYEGLSFEQEAVGAAARRRNENVASVVGHHAQRVEAATSAGETLTVLFDQWPDGPRVSSVVFAASTERQTSEAFATQLHSKYGNFSIRATGF